MKNLLIVCVDCLRADSFARLLATEESRIARALASGVAFQWAYSPAPWTYPATHSILTGLLPSRHGARHRGAYRRGVDSPWPERFDHQRSTIFTELAQLDYSTFGISTIFWALSEGNRYPGCDVLLRSAEQGVFYRCTPASWALDQFEQLFAGRLVGRRFAGYLHLMDLHRPYRLESAAPYLPEEFYPPLGVEDWNTPPPPRSAEHRPDFRRAKRAFYEALLRHVDAEVGRLCDFLARKRVLDETTIILLSDHGEEFWDHVEFERVHYDCGKKSSKSWLIGTGHGHTLFDELLHVPFVIINPPQPLPQRAADSLVSTLDVLPTVLDWVNLEPRAELDGQSLQRPRAGRIVEAEATLYGFERKAAITDRWKCIASPGDDHLAVFDRQKDREELNPLPVEVQPELAAKVLARFPEGIMV